MAYPLNFTAEQINHRLSLIAENKNLLPYPYDTVLPVGLTDVGDGSILTYVRNGAYSESEYFLNDCILPAGKYTISLDITTILEEPSTVSGFALRIDREGNEPLTVTDSAVLDLSAETKETTIKVYLIVPNSFDIGLVIKPQIEKGEEKTAWVPNMDQIGTYVDRRFNGTNAKIKVIDDKVMSVLNKFAELSDEQLQKLISFVDAYVVLEGPSEGLMYALRTDNTYEVTSIGDCTDTYIVIPSMYNEVAVYYIAHEAFKDCTSVKSIKISDGITNIGDYAFSNCTALTKIEIPVSVTTLGINMLNGCYKLQSIVFKGTKAQLESIISTNQIFAGTTIEYVECADENYIIQRGGGHYGGTND